MVFLYYIRNYAGEYLRVIVCLRRNKKYVQIVMGVEKFRLLLNFLFLYAKEFVESVPSGILNFYSS